MNEQDTRPPETSQEKETGPSAVGSANEDTEKQVPAAQDNGDRPYSIFTPWQKRAIVLGAAGTAFFSPLTAQIYLPALTQLSNDLNVTNTQINLTITTYMIFQGITPMFIGSLADSGGRRPAYIVCFVIYVAANIGLALAPGYSALLGLRCLQSAGSSSTVALCTAVVADVVTSAERGQYVGFTVIPAVLAPSLGPVIGGLLSQYLGWRAIFWFLAIFSGVAMILIFLFFPETCRGIVDDGSLTPPPLYRSVWQSIQLRRRRKARRQNSLSRVTTNASSASKAENKFKFKPPNLLGSLFLLFEKETGLLLWTSSLVFAGFYCIATAMPSLFSKRYGYNEIQVGLMYLPLAVGSIGAATIVGPSINRNYKRHCIRSGIPYDRSRQPDLSQFPIEKARLEIGLPLLCLGGACLIGWGWAMHAVTHVAVPCVISFFLGIGMIGYNNTTNILLVDVHPGRAGTATAANNLTRCLVGAGASAAIVPMIDTMGVGPAFTLVGGLYFVCIIPLLLILKFGKKWRAEAKAKAEAKKVKKQQKHEEDSATEDLQQDREVERCDKETHT
ncbi:general substrate transporter [Pochonia chlamydosporia 170]|uniref:General substrate transporter n=1 Tax=Pochonia chlamydosporia 170 TaxID=1380566 RepID=A0A179FYS8_METCM|nr:general substrate transporter [Pochonia chlamydosporia 170]OAQ70815.1 general substrate transporter [Pochonia chlamydosporia 170]